MEYNTFPSDYYFKWIITEQDYNKFMATGGCYEVEAHCPSTWEEHCKMAQQWSIGKWHGVKPQYVNLEKEIMSEAAAAREAAEIKYYGFSKL